MPARAIIINADDLGLWPAVDRGILDAWIQGAVSDSSIFATAPDLPTVLRQATDTGLPVGIHLNLTYGKPLSDPAAIPALVTADGAFMKRTMWTLPLPVMQVAHELRRQVERVLALGCHPSHLDSHHHVHAYPEILPVVIALAQELHVPVRATDAAMRATLTAAGIPHPDDFTMQFYNEAATADTLITTVEACPGGVLEIMTHPGYGDPDMPSSYRSEREQELRVLTSDRWNRYLDERGIVRMGFHTLMR